MPEPMFDSLGPLNIFICWESIALAAGVHVGTRSMKSALLLTAKTPRSIAIRRHIVMPCIPLILGAIAAVIFPLHPPWLELYIEENSIEQPLLIYFCYGGMIGVFADYIHQRIAGTIKLKEAMSETQEEEGRLRNSDVEVIKDNKNVVLDEVKAKEEFVNQLEGGKK